MFDGPPPAPVPSPLEIPPSELMDGVSIMLIRHNAT